MQTLFYSWFENVWALILILIQLTLKNIDEIIGEIWKQTKHITYKEVLLIFV